MQIRLEQQEVSVSLASVVSEVQKKGHMAALHDLCFEDIKLDSQISHLLIQDEARLQKYFHDTKHHDLVRVTGGPPF